MTVCLKPHEAKTLIEWIEKSKYKPNDWEKGFLQSIERKTFALSESQSETLQKIYERSSGGGIQRKQDIN